MKKMMVPSLKLWSIYNAKMCLQGKTQHLGFGSVVALGRLHTHKYNKCSVVNFSTGRGLSVVDDVVADGCKRTSWLLQFDGGSRGNPGLGGSGSVLYAVDCSLEIWHQHTFLGSTDVTNNMAEYQGLIDGLQQCVKMGITKVTIQGDSQLVIRQLLGIYSVKNRVLKKLHGKAIELLKSIAEPTLVHIPRTLNRRADALSNVAMDTRSTAAGFTSDGDEHGKTEGVPSNYVGEVCVSASSLCGVDEIDLKEAASYPVAKVVRISAAKLRSQKSALSEKQSTPVNTLSFLPL